MPVPPCLLGRGPIVGWGAQFRRDWGDAGTEGKAGTALFGEGSQAGCPCHFACCGAGLLGYAILLGLGPGWKVVCLGMEIGGKE